MTSDVDEIARSILDRLVGAWNVADGKAWGAEFIDDADFVNIFGMQLRGRREIEQRHQYLFDVLFKGSTCEVTVVDTRLLAPTIILAHSTSVAKIPSGPMAGQQASRQSIVFLRSDGGSWQIAALHNTLITSQL